MSVPWLGVFTRGHGPNKRATGENLRLLDRLLAKVERLLAINCLHAVTKEAVEAAQESLVNGLA